MAHSTNKIDDLTFTFFVEKCVDMNRIQCGRVPKSKYSVSDESVNSNGRERVLLPNLEGDVFKNRSALRTWGLMLKFFPFRMECSSQISVSGS